MNCDLLIHEATFHDDMSEDAIKKKHCTIAEAALIAQQMRAKHIILTHFSQRYPNAMAGAGVNKENDDGKKFKSTLDDEINTVSSNSEKEERLEKINEGVRLVGRSSEQKVSLLPPFARSNVSSPVIQQAAAATVIAAVDDRMSYAFDFLHFSFPSQISFLPTATKLLSNIMRSLDEAITNELS